MEEFYMYCLAAMTSLTNLRKQELLEKAGSAEDVFKMKDESVAGICEFNRITQLEKFLQERKNRPFAREFELLEKKKINFLSCKNPDFPKKLLTIPDIPVGIFYEGKLPGQTGKSVSIIGARTCSEYGAMMAKKFGDTLAKCGVTVISGMARGIDGISQMAALSAGGYSIGVLGCGTDICYPKENRMLYETLKQNGTLLSEYMPGTQPQKLFFPARNRLISGLCDALVVVEAREKSGTWITVDMALEQGRDVFALPGKATDSLSAGCNRLIKQGAGMILSVEELLEELDLMMETGCETEYEKTVIKPGEKSVLACLDTQPRSIEELFCMVNRVEKMSVGALTDILWQLSFMGLAKQVTSGYFVKTI